MWGAHALTLSRLPLAAMFWFVADQPRLAVVVLAIAALTDLFDGRVARWARRRGARGRIAEVGAWLDPLCDKLFAVTVLTALALRADAPVALLFLIGARELIVGPLTIAYWLTPAHRRPRYDFRASPAGKVATASQFIAVGAIVLDLAAALPLAFAAAILGVYAAAGYLDRSGSWSEPHVNNT